MQKETEQKLQKFYEKAKKQLSEQKNSPLKWFLEEVIAHQDAKLPRLCLLEKALKALKQSLPDKKQLNSLFVEESSITSIIIEAKDMVDIGFILKQHLDCKVIQKKIEYASIITETLESKIESIFKANKGNMFRLLRVNSIFDFIDFKQAHQKEVFDRISEWERENLRKEVYLLCMYVMKPWMEKYHPKRHYEDLAVMVYWSIILEDATGEMEKCIVEISLKLNHYLCKFRREEDSFTYLKVTNYILDMLAINYRKEDPFKPYCLASIMNAFENGIQSEIVNNWMISKGKDFRASEVEMIFRNTYNVGSTIFMFNLIDIFSQTLKQNRDFNTLYHLYLSYIKKEYLDVALPNNTFLSKYFDILEFYVIGFINRDRLDGESELDRLTSNISSLVMRKNFSFKKQYDRVITFYRTYEVRFQYLGSRSKKFMNDLIRIYRYNPDISKLHNRIHDKAFRQAGVDDDIQDAYQQLNVKRTDRYRGLMNLGNTCYMNSFMQALFMTKKFRSTILEIRDDQSVSSDQKMTYALINLFTEMSTKTIQADTEIIPDVFKNLTPEPFKSSWDQHDVGEYARMYLESLTDELGKDKNKGKVEKIFFNRIEKKLTCSKCKREKTNSQHVLDFILHLNKSDSEILVSKLLSDYFLGEEITGDNQVFCDKCNKKTDQLSVPEPVKLAEYLVITIGLFEYSGGGKKIKKPFSFQFTINFSKLLSNNQRIADENYQLYAFIVHIGNESERGHYICYARNLEENPTIWYCFDDGYVTEREIQNVSEFQFGESQTPYMLFYCTSKKRRSLNNLNSLVTSNLGSKRASIDTQF